MVIMGFLILKIYLTNIEKGFIFRPVLNKINQT